MAVEQESYNDAFRRLICAVTWPDPQKQSLPVHLAAINPTPVQLEFLLTLFPNTKVVAIVRNGIEVVSSRMEYQSFSANEFSDHCDVWNRSAEIAAWGSQNESRFFLFRHEWMYDSPAIAARFRSLFLWLAIEHSDAPLKNVGSKLSHPTSSDVELVESFESIDQSRKQEYFESKRNRWKTWTREQRAIFTEKCSDGMRQLDYQIPWQ